MIKYMYIKYITVVISEGAANFPEGSLVPGTSPPVLISPADEEIWTPSHTISTLLVTIFAFLRSGMPWPASRNSKPARAALNLIVGEVVPLQALREAMGEQMYSCKSVQTAKTFKQTYPPPPPPFILASLTPFSFPVMVGRWLLLASTR